MFCIKSNPFLDEKTRIPQIVCLMKLLWLRMCSGSHLVRLLTCTLGLGWVFCSLCLLQTDGPVLSMTELSQIPSDHIPKCHSCCSQALCIAPGRMWSLHGMEIQFPGSSSLDSAAGAECLHPWGNPSRFLESPQLVFRLCAAQAVLMWDRADLF